MAPEQLLRNTEYGFAIDLWSLGCCLFEIVEGNPPFSSTDPERLKQMLFQNDLPIKDYFSKSFSSLLQGLLEINPKRRLTIEQVKRHEFFKKVDWDKMLLKTIKAPILPKVNGEEDVKNIDTQLVNRDVMENSIETASIGNLPLNVKAAEQLNMFEGVGWTYNTDRNAMALRNRIESIKMKGTKTNNQSFLTSKKDSVNDSDEEDSGQDENIGKSILSTTKSKDETVHYDKLYKFSFDNLQKQMEQIQEDPEGEARMTVLRNSRKINALKALSIVREYQPQENSLDSNDIDLNIIDQQANMVTRNTELLVISEEMILDQDQVDISD